MANFPADPADMDDLVVADVWSKTVEFLDEFGIAMIGSPDGYEHPDCDHYVFDFGRGLKVSVKKDTDSVDSGGTRTTILSVEFYR